MYRRSFLRNDDRNKVGERTRAVYNAQKRCSGISAISQAQRSLKSMKRFQPRPVLRAIRAVAPKGIAGLGIRAGSCSECGAVHDRNVNAAKNILAAGRRRLAEGIPAVLGAGGRQCFFPTLCTAGTSAVLLAPATFALSAADSSARMPARMPDSA